MLHFSHLWFTQQHIQENKASLTDKDCQHSKHLKSDILSVLKENQVVTWVHNFFWLYLHDATSSQADITNMTLRKHAKHEAGAEYRARQNKNNIL